MAVELDEIAVLARVSKQLEKLSPAQRSWAMAFLERKFGERELTVSFDKADCPVGYAEADMDA